MPSRNRDSQSRSGAKEWHFGSSSVFLLANVLVPDSVGKG
jgi:hypothetical protein